MKYAVERLSPELIAEVEPMLLAYYGATEAHEGIPEYDFAWDQYAVLDQIDALLITTAREDGVLVGVAIYVIVQHPHHRTLRIAECDTLAVSLHSRGRGVGRGLYQFTEAQLKERGAHWITNRFRTVYGATPLFEKLGFEVKEQVYLKVVA